VGPSIRSNHNENTLLLREGELGHPEVITIIKVKLNIANVTTDKYVISFGG